MSLLNCEMLISLLEGIRDKLSNRIIVYYCLILNFGDDCETTPTRSFYDFSIAPALVEQIFTEQYSSNWKPEN
jgi:hypothetical protein